MITQTTQAHWRAIADATRGVYDNREATVRARVAYRVKHAQITGLLQALPPCRGTDEDVRNADL